MRPITAEVVEGAIRDFMLATSPFSTKVGAEMCMIVCAESDVAPFMRIMVSDAVNPWWLRLRILSDVLPGAWRVEPWSYAGLRRQDILAVSDDEQRRVLWSANPEQGVGHLDCQCPRCCNRYGVNIRNVDKCRLQCPFCNKGQYLADPDPVRDLAHLELLRAQGAERPHSLWLKRMAFVGLTMRGLPVYKSGPQEVFMGLGLASDEAWRFDASEKRA